MNNKTINYYNKYTKSFIQTTRSVDFTNIQNKFLSYLPSGASILDFGCGSGRDTKYFLKRNYNVTAIDGSEEICKEASKYTGIKVKQQESVLSRWSLSIPLIDRKSTRLNSSHPPESRMPSSA